MSKTDDGNHPAWIQRRDKYRERYKTGSTINPDDPLARHQLFTPKKIDALLRAACETLDLPVSRLLLIALDNELNKPLGEQFQVDISIPDEPFVENKYADEAVLIFEYLKKFPYGTGLDLLWLSRREIGILDRKAFLLGYRELLQSGMIETYYPQKSKHRYAKSYRYIRITGARDKIDYKKPEQYGDAK